MVATYPLLQEKIDWLEQDRVLTARKMSNLNEINQILNGEKKKAERERVMWYSATGCLGAVSVVLLVLLAMK